MTAAFGPAWLAGDPAAESLLPPCHREPSRWAGRVREAAATLDPRVRESLEAVNRGRDDPSVRDALDRLRGPLATVVAGQQVGLFGGPIYTVVKALAAVRWARRLSEASGQPVVPLFWLQTEDHDFDEVATWAGPIGEREVHRSSLEDDRSRVALGARQLPPEVEVEVESLIAAMGHGLDGPRVAEWLRTAYHPGRTWPGAFASLLGELLRGTGLLFVDPRHPAFSESAQPLHEQALSDHDELVDALRERSAELESAGFRAQVAVRSESLAFFHPEGPDGPRFRAARVAGGWRLAGRPIRVDDETVRAWLRDEPPRFSTSALLRPIVQDALLRVAAQVAGPGEVSYLAQCAPLYARASVRPGFVVPRPRVRLVEPWARRCCDRFQLRPEDVKPQLDATLSAMRPPEGPAPEPVAAALGVARRSLVESTEPLGDDVEPARRVLEAQLGRVVDRFVGKYERIRQRRDADRLAAGERLTARFFPGGIPQERGFGIIPFLVRYGSRYVTDQLAAALEADATAPRNVDL